jgi:hypothetical protein
MRFYSSRRLRFKHLFIALLSTLSLYKLSTHLTRPAPPSYKPEPLNHSQFESSNCYSAFHPFDSIRSPVDLKPHPTCDKPDWILLKDNATLVYNTAYLQSKQIQIKQCSYSTITWSDNDFKIKNSARRIVADGGKLDVDGEFFHVECVSTEGDEYRGAFARIFAKKPVREMRKQWRQPVNVFMLGLDSVSRENWLTKLANSSRFLIQELNATVLNGYNIVGDGTPAALIPILTGKHEHELPNANKGSEFVDRAYPLVWKEFEQRLGYATMFNEDWPLIGKKL